MPQVLVYFDLPSEPPYPLPQGLCIMMNWIQDSLVYMRSCPTRLVLLLHMAMLIYTL